MTTINLQFDSLKFIPVQNEAGQLFAYDVENYPNRLINSTDDTLFACYSIDNNGKLNEQFILIKKEELTEVWVKVV